MANLNKPNKTDHKTRRGLILANLGRATVELQINNYKRLEQSTSEKVFSLH